MDGKSPKITSVTWCKSMGNRGKVVSGAKHNLWALELTIVANLAAPEAADKQKSCNVGRFWTL